MRVAVVGRGPVGQFLAARFGVEPLGRDGCPDAQTDLVFVAVPDRCIEAAAGRLRSLTQAALVHCSGATARAVLGEGRGAVWHPMCAFPVGAEARQRLDDVVVGLRGDVDVVAWLSGVTKTWGATPVVIDEAQAVAVHAACCFAAGLCASVVARAATVMRESGVAPDIAKVAVGGLSHSAIQGWLDADVFTGPALRGDGSTLRAHHEVLGRHQALYTALTLGLCEQAGLDPAALGLISDSG